jgi:hypothetical protein
MPSGIPTLLRSWPRALRRSRRRLTLLPPREKPAGAHHAVRTRGRSGTRSSPMLHQTLRRRSGSPQKAWPHRADFESPAPAPWPSTPRLDPGHPPRRSRRIFRHSLFHGKPNPPFHGKPNPRAGRLPRRPPVSGRHPRGWPPLRPAPRRSRSRGCPPRRHPPRTRGWRLARQPSKPSPAPPHPRRPHPWAPHPGWDSRSKANPTRAPALPPGGWRAGRQGGPHPRFPERSPGTLPSRAASAPPPALPPALPPVPYPRTRSTPRPDRWSPSPQRPPEMPRYPPPVFHGKPGHRLPRTPRPPTPALSLPPRASHLPLRQHRAQRSTVQGHPPQRQGLPPPRSPPAHARRDSTLSAQPSTRPPTPPGPLRPGSGRASRALGPTARDTRPANQVRSPHSPLPVPQTAPLQDRDPRSRRTIPA